MLSIRADLPNLDGVIKTLMRMEHGDLPSTHEAINTALTLVQQTWIDYASGAVVNYSGGTFVIRRITGEYVRSIQDATVNHPARGDKLTGEIIVTSPYGHIIESGISPFDMKKTHLSGPKVKKSKKGSKYITVPFRHFIPDAVTGSAMPNQVYEQARSMAISRRNGIIKSVFSRRKYTWGDRMPESDEHMLKSHWTTGKYSGMVRMSGGYHTSYLTFRRLSENSLPEAWLHPGTEPRPVRQAVVENTKEQVIDLIRKGFELDVAQLGLGGN